jgi:hypothetical protein
MLETKTSPFLSKNKKSTKLPDQDAVLKKSSMLMDLEDRPMRWLHLEMAWLEMSIGFGSMRFGAGIG